MLYNILHGFHTTSSPFQLEEKRLKAAQEVVRKENPDVLVLTEACFAESHVQGIVMNYAEIFGYTHHAHARVVGGSEWGSSLLSKYPLLFSQNESQHYRTLLRTKIDVKGKEIYVDIAHPHPSLSDNEKAEFLKGVVEKYKKPYVLAGDFNAISPRDKKFYRQEEMIKNFSFEKDPKKKVNDLLQMLALAEVEKKGLKDTYKEIHKEFDFTIPTDMLSKNKKSGVRIDYIFCSLDFHVKDAYIVKNKLTEIASDHYPVIAVVEL